MVKDQAIRLEQMEKAHQELQEKHAKTCDDVLNNGDAGHLNQK